MRILLVSGACAPQVNGVVRTLQQVKGECEVLGHRVELISPEQFRTIPVSYLSRDPPGAPARS